MFMLLLSHRMLKAGTEIGDACSMHAFTGNAYKVLGGTPEEVKAT